VLLPLPCVMLGTGGFAMLMGLVGDGLADVQAETVSAGGRTTEIVRVRITAAGRRAIED
jgi:hypothetical protein